MDNRLEGIYLTNGMKATDYVESLHEEDKEVATEAILECMRLGYNLNRVEIEGKGREINRKRMGIIR